MTSDEGCEMKDVLDNKISFSSIYIEGVFFSTAIPQLGFNSDGLLMNFFLFCDHIGKKLICVRIKMAFGCT